MDLKVLDDHLDDPSYFYGVYACLVIQQYNSHPLSLL